MRTTYICIVLIIDILMNMTELSITSRGIWRIRKILLRIKVLLQKKIDYSYLDNHFKQLISNSTLVFDIGSNAGKYTSIFLKYSKKVLSVEPQAELCLLQNKLFKKEIQKNKLIIENIAIDSKNGIVELHINSKNGLSSTSKKYQTEVIPKEFSYTNNIETVKVRSKNIDSLIELYGKPDYIKIDIEGSEKNAIMSLSHNISLLSFECNLPYFKKEMFAIMERISDLGQYKYIVLQHKEFVFKSRLKTGYEIKSLVQNKKLNNVFDLYCVSVDYNLKIKEQYSSFFM